MPRRQVNGFLGHHFQLIGSCALIEDHKICAGPAGIGDQYSFKFEEESDFGNLLERRVFALSLDIVKSTILGHIRADFCQSTIASQIKNARKISIKLMQRLADFGGKNGLPLIGMEVRFRQCTIPLDRRIEHIETAIIPPSAGPSGSQGIKTSRYHPPQQARELCRLARIKRVYQRWRTGRTRHKIAQR